MFIVHGRDEEAKQAVVRCIEKLGLKAVILHERPNKGRTIIEKLEDHTAKTGFVVVLLIYMVIASVIEGKILEIIEYWFGRQWRKDG